MSGSLSPTVAAVPTITAVSSNILGLMAALNGQVTDYNQGSLVRTQAESQGSVVRIQGIADVALAFQALAYGAMSLFGIAQASALAATGVITFATALPVSSAPVVPQAVPIPAGTLVQTNGGIQFSTLVATTLASGTSSISVGIVATAPGANGNVAAGAIVGSPLTPVGWPLYVTNSAATAGGANAGTQSNALAQFTTRVASLGLSSPVAVANAPIGVVATGTGETVRFAAAYEPWIAAGSGAGSGDAGFTVFVDDGTGAASADLLAAVVTQLNGSVALNESGFRPIGVPYIVSGVTPVYASATVSGTLFPGLLATGSVATAVTNNILDYFNTLPFSPAQALQASIAARAGDAGLGAFSALTVNLYYSGSSTPVPLVSGDVGTRVILAGLDVSITVGT